MKVGEVWRHKSGSEWKIIRLLPKFEKIIVECVKHNNKEHVTEEEKLLAKIFGEVNIVGELDEYYREDFVKSFTKIYK